MLNMSRLTDSRLANEFYTLVRVTNLRAQEFAVQNTYMKCTHVQQVCNKSTAFIENISFQIEF